MYATHFGNRIVTPAQLAPGGDFERLFSYTHSGLCALFEHTAAQFDLRSMNPDMDTAGRGIADVPVEQPALGNRTRLMGVIRDHVERYVLQSYGADQDITADAALARWMDELARMRGVREVIGSPPSRAGLIELLATLIYMVSVEHEIVDSGVWDYHLWSDVSAPRVYRDGRRMPLDVYQRLVNANFILNVDRTHLMEDFSYLALDDAGAEAFRQFSVDLHALQRAMDRDGGQPLANRTAQPEGEHQLLTAPHPNGLLPNSRLPSGAMMSDVDGVRRVATVTVLVCDLVSSTVQRTSLGDDLADRLAAALDYYLRQSVMEHGGSVVKSTGDGLIATFDAASDALAAAVVAHQRIERRNRHRPPPERLVMRVGAQRRRRAVHAHDLHGTPVVEAARLEAAADPGSIFASALVRSLAGSRGGHRFEPVGTLELKGLPTSIDTFRVGWDPLPADDEQGDVPMSQTTASRIPLPARLATPPVIGVIGYTGPLQAIADARRRVAAGHGREALLVMGEAGQGKTTVIAAAARAAFDDGFCVLFGHCEEDLALPYQLFVEALDHYVAHVSADSLFAHVNAYGFELARLVPLLAERIPELRHSTAAEPETERFLVFAAATGLLAAASSQQPVVLVLDDLQWADKASLSLLVHVVATLPAARVLVVGTIRDTELVNAHDLREALGGLQRHGGFERVELLGLDRSEVLAYMEAGAGYALTGAAEQALATAVHRETDGNPFFVGQVLRHLVETGMIYRDDTGRWSVEGPVERLTLPDSVREVIGGRVVRLGIVAKRVLGLAAVIGRDFDIELLTRAAVVPADKLIDILDAAVAAALVREVPDQPGRFQFSHALIQRTLYEDLGPTRRQWAHRQVAEALEELCADNPAARISELARHWTHAPRAEDRPKAIAFARQAGETALAALAPAQARDFYRKALELLEATPNADPALDIDLAVGLGTAQRQTGDPLFRDTLLAAARRAIDLDDAPRLVAAALAAHRGLFSNFGAIDHEQVAIFEAALARMGRDDPNRALILATYCLEVVVGTPLERRQALADEALAIAEASGDEAVIIRVLNNLAYALDVSADARAGAGSYDRSPGTRDPTGGSGAHLLRRELAATGVRPGR